MADTVLGTDADPQQYTGKLDANASVSKASVAAYVVRQSELQSRVAASREANVPVWVNASASAKKVDDSGALPELPEETGTAYAGVGKPYEIKLVRIGNFRMEKTTGYDFILMRRAAYREAKLVLNINSAFRTMEEQERLYAQRQAEPSKGPAAVPGTSNHQQGLSLDIQTDIAFGDWKTGTVTMSPVHEWLVANAGRFGFDQRDLGKLPDGRRYEPWHWTHAADGKIYGLTDPGSDVQGVYDELVSAGAEASFSANGQPDWLRIILKAGNDYIGAFSRSGYTSLAGRQTFFDAAAAQGVLQSAEIKRRGANHNTVLNAEMPAGFSSEPPLYDFETGTWTDEGTENALGV